MPDQVSREAVETRVPEKAVDDVCRAIYGPSWLVMGATRQNAARHHTRRRLQAAYPAMREQIRGEERRRWEGEVQMMDYERAKEMDRANQARSSVLEEVREALDAMPRSLGDSWLHIRAIRKTLDSLSEQGGAGE